MYIMHRNQQTFYISPKLSQYHKNGIRDACSTTDIFNDRRSGLVVVYLWCTSGQLVVYLWSTSGLLVIYKWSTCGLQVVPMWSLTLILKWSPYGPQVV